MKKRLPIVVLCLVLLLTAVFTLTTSASEEIFVSDTNLRITDEYIRDIPLGATGSDFLMNFVSTPTGIAADDIVKTGMAIVVGDSTFYPVIKGDVNGDGRITTADYATIKKVFNRTKTLTDAFKEAADVDENGSIQTVDYIRVKKYFQGYSLYEGMCILPGHWEDGVKLESSSLIPDLYFKKGFKVRDLGGEQGTTAYIGYFPSDINKKNVKWTLAQWSARYSFMDKTVSEEWKPSDGVWYVSSPNEVFGVDTNTGLLTFQCNGSKCYDTPRTGSEPWMHLLIETPFIRTDDWSKVSDLKHLYVTADTQLTKFEDHMGSAADKNIHAAQFLMYLTIQNLNIESPDYGKYIWFGISMFDNRYEKLPSYYNVDPGTGSMIYGLPTSKTCTSKYRYVENGVIQAGTDTPWVSYYKDVVEDVKIAFEKVQRSGMLQNSTLDDMYISGMNIGWEVPGTYDVEMLVKNLNVVAERAETTATE